MPPVISLIIPSRRPAQLSGLLKSLNDTIKNPKNVEVFVKIDDDVQEALASIVQHQERYPFEIKWINTPRLGGQFTLWIAMDDLFFLSDDSSYFIMMLSDETRFLTKGWDEILLKYQHYFDDDVFRLKVSDHKYVNYNRILTCFTKPDCFPIMTRKWVELVGGLCSFCYAPDCMQQSISFHLAMGRKGYDDLWNHEALFRDVPVDSIRFSGWDFGQDIKNDERSARDIYTKQQWLRSISYPEQRKAAYLARKIFLYCWAKQNGYEQFFFLHDGFSNKIHLLDADSLNTIRTVKYRSPIFRANFQYLYYWVRFSLGDLARYSIAFFEKIIETPLENTMGTQVSPVKKMKSIVRASNNLRANQSILKELLFRKSGIDHQKLPTLGFGRYKNFQKTDLLKLAQSENSRPIERYLSMFLLTAKTSTAGKFFIPIRLAAYLTSSILLRPIKSLFLNILEIPPAGVEKKRLISLFSRELKIKRAGYVLGDYDELLSEMDRLRMRQINHENSKHM